ncbi:MAG: hypothetical protein FJ278_06240, partial [Planctomycetes bacterium]|nr:hypothetical protein [Planctomycetota bacterium]
LYPFYLRDTQAGILSDEQAQELVECLFIKCSEIVGYADQRSPKKRSHCQDSVQYVVLGGQKGEMAGRSLGGFGYGASVAKAHVSAVADRVQPVPSRRLPDTPKSGDFGYGASVAEARVSAVADRVQPLPSSALAGDPKSGDFGYACDAVNELSFLALRAGHLKLKQPTIIVRYHRGLNREFWREVCELIRAGGSVGIYNDHTVVPALESVGVEPQDALGYTHYGCCNPNIPGQEGSLIERWHNLPKFVELALNNGKCPVKGQPLGPATGDPDTFRTFEDLQAAVRAQMRHALEAERRGVEAFWAKESAMPSFTAESLFLEGCVENGREWRRGGTKYYHKMQHAVGIGTATDSLVALRNLVFEEKRLTLGQFRDILNASFAGHEELRQELLNRCPKFGNDDDAVDSVAVWLANAFCDEVARCNRPDHRIAFWPELYSYHNNKNLGDQTGATADGRRRGESLSENQSPSYGADRNGVTALLNSMAKLPFHRTPGGGTNILIHPTAVKGEDGLRALMDLLETYFQRGGMHLQVNIVDKRTLLEAQKSPEKFRTLTVRVTGYSGYFVTLDPRSQQDVIARTEHVA